MWNSRHTISALAIGVAFALGIPAAQAQSVRGAPNAGELMSAGESALEKGQFDVAVEKFGRAMRAADITDEQVARALYRRGLASERAGRPAQAIADITSALYLPGLPKPDRADAYLSRGRAYEAVGMDDLARSDIARARSGGADERQIVRSSQPAHSASGRPDEPSFATSSEPAGRRTSAPSFATSSQTAETAAPSFETRADTPAPAAAPRQQRVAAFETQSRAAAGQEEPIPRFRTTIVPQETRAPATRADTQTAARPPGGGSPAGWSTSASGDQPAALQPPPKDETGSSSGFFGNLWSKATGGSDKKEAAAPAPPASATPQWNQTTSVARAPQQNAPQPGWTAQAVPAQQGSRAPAPPADSAGGSGYRIQLAALRSSEEAESTWKRLQSKHGNLLGGRQPNIVKTELGGLGTFYRVQLGPFADKASSQQLCNDFKSGGLDCFLLAP